MDDHHHLLRDLRWTFACLATLAHLQIYQIRYIPFTAIQGVREFVFHAYVAKTIEHDDTAERLPLGEELDVRDLPAVAARVPVR